VNILITGGAGYIGSHTCKHLAQQGHTVVAYDNLSTGWKDLVKWGPFVHGDIRDTQRLRQAMRRHKADGVIHFAAKAAVGESVVNPAKYFSNNVTGTLCILEAMRDEGVRHIVVSGTCAVYGEPERVPISEASPTCPVNPYGASKLFMERMLADFEAAHDLRWMSLRYFNAAGCDPDGETGERHDPETHLIPNILRAVKGEIPALALFGDDYPTPDGTCIRDYVHVCDLARAHALALEYLAKGGKGMPINLGSEKGFSIKELLTAAEQIIGRPVPYAIAGRRPGDPPRLVADAARAKTVLQWEAAQSDVAFILRTAWEFARTCP
jgi:UDP-glucose-4-epimerase GalE